ncbi:MAG: sigma-70 family RNA polymerase sigma factor [Pirellulales bacterium]
MIASILDRKSQSNTVARRLRAPGSEVRTDKDRLEPVEGRGRSLHGSPLGVASRRESELVNPSVVVVRHAGVRMQVGAPPRRRVCGPLLDAEKTAIYEQHQGGVSLETLAGRYGKSKATVTRVVNEARARQILGRKIEYVFHPAFSVLEAEELLSALPSGEGNGQESRRTVPQKGLPPYLASLYEIPLLNREEEAHLFRKMNYLKWCASQLRETLNPARPRATTLDRIERLLDDALAVRNQIIRANLRLVVSIAKRYVDMSQNFDELVSEGNTSLFRAVDLFDCSRGNKFSTYATWAVRNNLIRTVAENHRQRRRFFTGQEETFQATADERDAAPRQESDLVQLGASLALILDKLTDRERAIITWRFGLDHEGDPKSFKDIGTRLGVSKERIRQLTDRALNKLREHAEEERMEAMSE